MESSSPSILSDGYTRKENCMTTTARGAVREQATEEQGGAEQDIYPLLLATLIGRRQEHREEITPLLLAALMGRRQQGELARDRKATSLFSGMAARCEERMD